MRPRLQMNDMSHLNNNTNVCISRQVDKLNFVREVLWRGRKKVQKKGNFRNFLSNNGKQWCIRIALRLSLNAMPLFFNQKQNTLRWVLSRAELKRVRQKVETFFFSFIFAFVLMLTQVKCFCSCMPVDEWEKWSNGWNYPFPACFRATLFPSTGCWNLHKMFWFAWNKEWMCLVLNLFDAYASSCQSTYETFALEWKVSVWAKRSPHQASPITCFVGSKRLKASSYIIREHLPSLRYPKLVFSSRSSWHNSSTSPVTF